MLNQMQKCSLSNFYRRRFQRDKFPKNPTEMSATTNGHKLNKNLLVVLHTSSSALDIQQVSSY